MVIVLCLVAKFICILSFVVVYLQAVELFPTGCRSMGMGITTFVSQVVGLLGPFLVQMGMYNKAIPHIGLGFACFIGTIAASFLPETIGVDLPETLTEASDFGRDQPFFSFKPKPRQEVKPA